MELDKFRRDNKGKASEEDQLRIELIQDTIKNNGKLDNSLLDLIG